VENSRGGSELIPLVSVLTTWQVEVLLLRREWVSLGRNLRIREKVYERSCQGY
jgi:hypothetical protein